MLIAIETEHAVIHEMNVWPSMTVLELKQRMERKSGAKVAQQVFWLNGLKLKDDKTLNYYGLRDGMELYFKYNYLPTGIVTISAKTNTKTYNMVVNETITVVDLKEMIHQLSGIPIEPMTLYHGETPLENSTPLFAYYICEGSLIRIGIGDEN
ncbi:uncharacterized protein LOC122651233 [Telopea speciosissima]|uniref:uncharacterized protein LOC122651233 n=1 Tax=Telopea speciosissima TaxID=54955 RepID=UPI001CC7C934|nr:uncharacterized protein LOC122651233 [Telopea speciosissima]